MKTVNHLGTDPIGKLVPRIAFPSMLAQFVSVLYSIVDRMYIGHIASVGDLALAGVGVCGPILTMIGAFSSLIGVGGAPLLGAAKPVIKAHGSSKAKGIKNAIRQAKLCVANDLCGTMQSALAEVAAKAAAEKTDAE